MNQSILFPSKHDLDQLASAVGGLVFASYTFPANDTPAAEKMAVQIASGQTLGFVPDDLSTYERFIGRVVSVEILVDRGRAVIAFPATLFGIDLAGILTILFGKISFAPEIRLEAISADARFLERLKGPKLGLQGIRRVVGKEHGKQPLLMAILKPGLGPSDTKLADQFRRLVSSGTDLVKDDETRIDISLTDALRRLEAVLTAGKGQGLYVTHLSGPAFEIRDRALAMQRAGAQAFLFCPFTYGLGHLQALCSDPEINVPIFAHPAFTGIMTFGSSHIKPAALLGTLMRWAGADAVLYPSPYGSIALPKSDAIAIHQNLVRSVAHMPVVASVPSAGIQPEHVAKIHEDFGRDVIINAGTGMARGTGGVEEGSRLFKKAIEASYV
jgi:2,3-diketo-5-methylthiopentyl-1-phosphate enolase